MLATLRDLFCRRAFTDAALLNAIRRHETAARDQELRTLLHHILVAHRYWIQLGQGLPFFVEEETTVCMHSHGHRSQCATKLRALGGEPPRLDFILWLKDRPAPVWE